MLGASIFVESADKMTAISQIIWSETFAMGWPELDADRREAVGLINKFIDSIKAVKSCGEPSVILEQLLRLTKDHFQRENQLLESGAFANSAHIASHDDLMTKLKKVASDFDNGAIAPEVVAENLKAWFFDHAIKFDATLKGAIG